MELLQKEFLIPKKEILTAAYIENYISKEGFEPLRWAIVKVDSTNLVIESVVIKNNNGF